MTLIITGGKAPDFKQVEKYINKSSYIIAADSGLDSIVRWGLIPDLIVGDMDSISDKKLLKKYSDAKILTHPIAKDYSDTELALIEGKKRKDEMILIGGGEGRFDHSLAILDLFRRYSKPDIWITAVEKIIYIKGCYRHSGKSGDQVSLYPMMERGFKCSSRGLKWDISADVFHSLGISLSNQLSQRNLYLEVENGKLLLFLPLKD